VKSAFVLFFAVVMALAVTEGALAGSKRKVIRPQLTSQVLSASYKAAQNLALLKAQQQIRMQRPAIGKF
jgi:hypothetical protein